MDLCAFRTDTDINLPTHFAQMQKQILTFLHILPDTDIGINLPTHSAQIQIQILTFPHILHRYRYRYIPSHTFCTDADTDINLPTHYI